MRSCCLIPNRIVQFGASPLIFAWTTETFR
jgi:hypothetical protein